MGSLFQTPLTISQNKGLVRDLNPGPLAPKARIIPLDQRAMQELYLMLFFSMISKSLTVSVPETKIYITICRDRWGASSRPRQQVSHNKCLILCYNTRLLA